MTREPAAADLTGCCVLIVEDQFLLADEMQHAVERLGATVLGPIPNVQAALRAIAESRPDIAILDLDLNGSPAYPIAEALQAAGVPFAFTTGFDAASVDPRFGGVRYIEKPVRMRVLADVLLALRALA